MKSSISFLALTLIIAGPASGLAQGPSRQGWAPPGWQKKEWIPKDRPKGNPPPPDVLITNEPDTNVVMRPAPAKIEAPVYESKRVESPRGAVLSDVVPPQTTAARPEPAVEPAKPVNTGDAAKLGRELDASLRQLNATWLNQHNRMTVLRSIAIETGVPVQTLISQFNADNKLRGSELLLANKIAAESERTFEDVMAAYQQNQDWLATGEKFGVSSGTLVDVSKRIAAGQ